MPFGKKAPEVVEPEPVVDPTSWMIDGSAAEFLLLHTNEIKYMCLLGYTYFQGTKVFSMSPDASPSFKFASLIMLAFGGSILVPIFINGIPVPLVQDAYIIAVAVSYAVHHYFPVGREVMELSPIMKTAVVVMYETMRAFVVVNMTRSACVAIPTSYFSFPLFGPIICGGIGGCGGAFLPMNKGLDPIKKTGLATGMLSALVAAAGYHLFVNTSASDGIIEAEKKAHVHVAAFFITVGLASEINRPTKK